HCARRGGALLAHRRAARQGRGLCDPGARGGIRRGALGQLFWCHGSTALRDSRAPRRGRRSGLGRPRGMSTEILINGGLRETRAAIVENGALQEVHIERASRRGLVGNVYKGRVTRVLPGMQAAFVDAGLERAAFLHVDDIAVTRPDATMVGLPTIDDIRRLVTRGDEILVQIVKDPLGTKGARLTTFLSLPSRFLVYMPRSDGNVGVSARIEDEAERQRLRELIADLPQPAQGGGFILRTAAAGVTRDALRADMIYLGRLWDHVRERALAAAPGALVHEDLPLPTRMLRDELGRDIERVLVDASAAFGEMQAFARAFMPE